MSGNRIFSLKPEVRISAEEAAVIVRAYEQIKGTPKEIGHIVQEIAQEALEAAVVRFTMVDDRSG